MNSYLSDFSIKYRRLAAGPAVVLVFLLAAVLAPAVVRADNGTLIIPGRSVGPISLGMSAADLYRALGDPDNVGTDADFPSGKLYWYNSRGLHVTIDQSSVVQIAVTSPQYTTQDGVGIGSTELRVSALLGAPSITKTYQNQCEGRVSGYHYPGLWIHFDCSGHVAEMRVWSGT